MAKLFANSGDPDQTPRYVASDLGLHCLPITLLRVSQLQWVKKLHSVNSISVTLGQQMIWLCMDRYTIKLYKVLYLAIHTVC